MCLPIAPTPESENPAATASCIHCGSVRFTTPSVRSAVHASYADSHSHTLRSRWFVRRPENKERFVNYFMSTLILDYVSLMHYLFHRLAHPARPVAHSAARKAAQEPCLAQVDQTADEADDRQHGCGVQQECEELGSPVRGTLLIGVSVKSSAQSGARTVNPNLSTASLVMHSAKNALLKIHSVTSRVRKDLYESSSVFFSTSFFSLYGVRARLTVCSNCESMSFCNMATSSITTA